jgi:hypothetical protein
VLGELDTRPIAWRKSRVPRQLQPFQGCGNDAPLEVKSASQFFRRCCSTEQQHRHAREVAAIEREDLGRNIVKRIR